MDNVDELVKEDMNGRQIRNAIITARQMALYEGRNVLLCAFESCYRSQWGVREVFEDAEARVVG